MVLSLDVRRPDARVGTLHSGSAGSIPRRSVARALLLERTRVRMATQCEIDGCSVDAQPKLTTSGYEFCLEHYEQWAGNNMFVVEDGGKVLLMQSATGPGRARR